MLLNPNNQSTNLKFIFIFCKQLYVAHIEKVMDDNKWFANLKTNMYISL